MDITINIEALTFILNKLNVSLITEEKTDKLLKEYQEYKKAYLDIRIFGKFNNNICIQALYSFKAHLKKHPYLMSEKKDIIIEKIKLVDKQLELVNVV